MTHVIRAGAIAAAVLFSLGANASEYIADSSEEEHIPIVVRDVFVGNDAARRAMQTDREFARNMSCHHQGAVDMATAYLKIRAAQIRSSVVSHAASSTIKSSRSRCSTLSGGMLRPDRSR